MRRNLAPGCISSDVKLCQRKPLFHLFWGPLFLGPCFLFFYLFLALQRLARLKCNLEPNCGAYLGCSHTPARLRILCRTRSFPGRTSARSLSGRIESVWETPSKERVAQSATELHAELYAELHAGRAQKMGHACFQFRTPRGQQPKNGCFQFRADVEASIPSAPHSCRATCLA